MYSSPLLNSPQGGGQSLDGPPPLPSSAQRPANNLLSAGANQGMGEAGGSPQATLVGALAQVETGLKILASLIPSVTTVLGDLQSRLRPIVAQAVASMSAAPAPPQMPNAPQGPEQQQEPQGGMGSVQ